MTGPEGNSEFCFPRISVFPETKSRETLRFEGNKIHCFPREQSLSDLLYSKTKRKQILNNALKFQQQQSTRVTANCFPFDVIVFAMLPAHCIWRETVNNNNNKILLIRNRSNYISFPPQIAYKLIEAGRSRDILQIQGLSIDGLNNRENTTSLLDVMWPWTSQSVGAL